MIMISIDLALEEFESICEAARVLSDESRMKDDELDSFRTIKTDICDAIQDGVFSLNDEGRPTYTSECGKEFTFRQLSGRDYLDLDKYSGKQQMRATLALASTMCSVEIKQLTDLDGADTMFIIKVAGFFIGSRRRRSSTLKNK